MTEKTPEPIEVLAVGAHPDDVELGVGGLVHKLTSQGRTVAIVDLTRGEMSSRGTVEEREGEAEAAAQVLGVAQRRNAGLPDGAIADETGQQRALIPWIRAFRPRVLLAPMSNDRHPDHHAAHYLVRSANYFAGLTSIETGHEPYRAPRIYSYAPYMDERMPEFVVDVSGHFDAKTEALRAHASQFHNPEYDGPPTYIASAEFWQSIRTRAVYWGSRIGAEYGEPLFAQTPVAIAFPPGLEPNS